MRREAITTLVIASLLTLPMLAVSAGAAEQPFNRSCDEETGLLACAGADAGADASCTLDPFTGAATCDWSFGWNLEATSDAGLPGEGTLSWSYEVTICTGGVCGSGGDADTIDCTWTPGDACTESFSDSGSSTFFLETGDCVSVTSSVTASADSTVPSTTAELASASASDSSSHSASVCMLDNGR